MQKRDLEKGKLKLNWGFGISFLLVAETLECEALAVADTDGKRWR